jgi:hypothetical protein
MPVIKTTKKPKAKSQAAQKPAKKTAQKVTLDDVWVTIDQIGQALKENQTIISELQQAHKETEKTLNKAIGELSNKLGSIVERILTPDLPNKFKKLGFSFSRIATYKWTAGVYAQIDGMLENGAQAMAVEVKTTLRYADVDDHLERMAKIRAHADEQGDKRQFYCALAAMTASDSAKAYALKKGIYIIEPSGEDVKITKPTADPKVW